MSRLDQIIEQNLSNPHLTNIELASLLGMSERQFYRKVEDLTGTSPNIYLRNVRLNRAESLLDSREYSTVKEVALRVGFLKVSYFSKLYEARFGLKPSQILKQIK